jgi:hypothetical protein
MWCARVATAPWDMVCYPLFLHVVRCKLVAIRPQRLFIELMRTGVVTFSSASEVKRALAAKSISCGGKIITIAPHVHEISSPSPWAAPAYLTPEYQTWLDLYRYAPTSGPRTVLLFLGKRFFVAINCAALVKCFCLLSCLHS